MISVASNASTALAKLSKVTGEASFGNAFLNISTYSGIDESVLTT